MAKARKPAVNPEPPSMPRIGDKVIPERSESTWVITHVSPSGEEVNLNLEGTNLERFRVSSDTLKFVDRAPLSSKPAAEPQPKLNVGEVLERIGTVQRENMQRLEDDIAILIKYLKTEGAPKAAIDLLNTLGKEQRSSWQIAVDRIQKLLSD
jgi:hypothetical protein